MDDKITNKTSVNCETMACWTIPWTFSSAPETSCTQDSQCRGTAKVVCIFIGLEVNYKSKQIVLVTLNGSPETVGFRDCPS